MFRTVVLSGIVLAGCSAPVQPIPDGKYFGYDSLANLSPDEDPYGEWFYKSELEINGNRVSIEQSPRFRTHGKVFSSSSDGGFPRYEGVIEKVGERTIVRLHKTACDYCGIPVDDPLPSKIEREYVVRFLPDGSFELDRVTYQSKPNPSMEITPN